MSIFDYFKLCLFSEVNATVTLKGEPVIGAKITQSFRWQNKTITRAVDTDQNGHFHFDTFYKHSIGAVLPHEPVISQEMLITYDGKDYLAWNTVKRDYKENDELDGKTIKLLCELTEPETRIKTRRSGVSGICSLQ